VGHQDEEGSIQDFTGRGKIPTYRRCDSSSSSRRRRRKRKRVLVRGIVGVGCHYCCFYGK